MRTQTASESDVTFGAHAQGPLTGTLYRPAGSAQAAVVEIHGGGWTSGDRTSNVAIARHLAAHGIAVLSVDFRMPPAARYPETVADAAAGLRWMLTHSTDVGTTPDRVGLLGTSSGGHLALLLALRPRDERYTGPAQGGEPALAVRFAALGWPVNDPLARYLMVRDRTDGRLRSAHHAFWADEAEMAEGSPYDIVRRGDAQQLPSLLILQGTNDDNLTPDMQQKFVTAYRERGARVDLELFEGQPHSFISKDPEAAAARAALERTTAFILREASGAGKDGSGGR